MLDAIAFFLTLGLLVVQSLGTVVVYLIFREARSKSVNLRVTMYYPLLVAGALYTLAALSEMLEDLLLYGPALHSAFMLSVALVMLYGFYTYYRMVKKLP